MASSIAPPGPPAQAVPVEIPTATTPATISGATKRILGIPSLLDEVLKIVPGRTARELSKGIRGRRSG